MLNHRRPDDRPEDDENFVFVTDGIEAAVAKAKELAGDKNVGVNGGQMARQCLDAGLLECKRDPTDAGIARGRDGIFAGRAHKAQENG